MLLLQQEKQDLNLAKNQMYKISKVEWDFGLVSSERSLEAVGKFVRLHIISRSKVFDLFPRTYKGKNRCVSRRKHALINSRERPLKSDINLEQSSHVECVALMTRTEQ